MEESRGQTPGALQATHGEELGLSSGPALPGGAFCGGGSTLPLCCLTGQPLTGGGCCALEVASGSEALNCSFYLTSLD